MACWFWEKKYREIDFLPLGNESSPLCRTKWFYILIKIAFYPLKAGGGKVRTRSIVCLCATSSGGDWRPMQIFGDSLPTSTSTEPFPLGPHCPPGCPGCGCPYRAAPTHPPPNTRKRAGVGPRLPPVSPTQGRTTHGAPRPARTRRSLPIGPKTQKIPRRRCRHLGADAQNDGSWGGLCRPWARPGSLGGPLL